MRAIWLATRGFRAYVDPQAGVATIVGNQIHDDAVGTRFGAVAVVADSAGAVTDLEIDLRPRTEPSAILLPAPETVPERDVVTTTIPAVAASAALADGWLTLSFGAAGPDQWVRLTGLAVYLNVDGERLKGVAIASPETDPGGGKEAAWIATLEQAPEARG